MQTDSSEKTPSIIKASGEREPFSREKLAGSLRNAGANEKNISYVLEKIDSWIRDGVTTKKLYNKAFALLRSLRRADAARYSLKKAIMELGPTGYPFEHLIGQLLSHQGFRVEVGQMVQGQCVDHEVDVIATANNKQYFVECKYFNSQGKQANVQVPLYIRSRVDDIVRKRESLPGFKDYSFYGWVITNTRFTEDAEVYGKCAGLTLIGWDYPKGHSLKEMIEQNGFFPVTVLTNLTKQQKHTLLEKGIVLCRQIDSKPGLLDQLDLKEAKKRKVTEEIGDLCSR